MATEIADALASAMLTSVEQRVLERLVAGLRREMGGDLRAVWLYGSRARGDAVIDEVDFDRHSDIDLLAIADGGEKRYGGRSVDLLYEIADAEGVSPVWYSLRVRDPDWLRGRREIRSFFIQNVERDRIVLYGSGLE